MCNANCCCRQLSSYGMINFLFLFTGINLLLSIIAIFIRAASTERYDQALIYLEAINNGSLSDFNSLDCAKGGYIFKDEDYCQINGENLKKPANEISYQSLFKKWKSVELVLNISRAIITVIFLVFLFFVIKKKGDNLGNMDKEEKEEYNKYLGYLLIFIGFLIFLSGLYILIRALALTANNGIGLYPDNDQNPFEEKIAFNYILDIIEIVLYGIEICFVLRLKNIINRPSPRPVINKPVTQTTKVNPVPFPVVVQQSQQINIVNQEIRVTQQITENQRIHPMDVYDY